MRNARATRVVEYIESLPDFRLVRPDVPFSHMGATITDAILQAGMKYDTVVKPRVTRLRTQYSEARTTTGFLRAVQRDGVRRLIDWRHPEKANRIVSLATFLANEEVETESDLRRWLAIPGNPERLTTLRGIGQKTLDYLRILAGESSVAVDRHLCDFLASAGIFLRAPQYQEARFIIEEAAATMGIEAEVLDHSIWRFMSENRTRAQVCRD